MPEKIKSFFKLKEDYSFFAMPTEEAKKNNLETLRIIEFNSKKIIVGPSWNLETNQSNPSSLKHEVTVIGK